MLRSKWGTIGLATVALTAVLVFPATSEAQRRGGGGGGRGWNGSGGRGWEGDHGWEGNRGWGGAGVGIYLGSPGYGGYGYGRGYGYYDGGYYNASPTYDYSANYYNPTTTSSYYSAPQQADPNSAMIRMRVPANAEVFIEGTATTQRGTERDFVSPPLEANKTFVYSVRIRYTDANGQVVDRTRKVSVHAGDRLNLDLMNEAAAANATNEPAIRRDNADMTPRDQRPAANQVNRPADNRPIDRANEARPDSTTNEPNRIANPANSNQAINGQRPQ